MFRAACRVLGEVRASRANDVMAISNSGGGTIFAAATDLSPGFRVFMPPCNSFILFQSGLKASLCQRDTYRSLIEGVACAEQGFGNEDRLIEREIEIA